MTEPNKKRGHYIPATYLRGFCDSADRVWAYRKDEPTKPLHVSPGNIAFEKYYYAQPKPDGSTDFNSIENFFQTIETTWPGTLTALRTRQDGVDLAVAIFQFLAMMRTRIPATRDAVELALAHGVRTLVEQFDKEEELPPPPPGLENFLEIMEVSIDPHQSIHAIPDLLRELGQVLENVGIEILHNQTDLSFISSDNPVAYFDPDISEEKMLPYNVRPPKRSVELFFPLDSQTVLRGSSDLRRSFGTNGLDHRALTDVAEIKRINRIQARFGYRFIFADSQTHTALVQKYALHSPVPDFRNIAQDGGRMLLSQMVFGKRPKKAKWKRR